MTTNSATEFEGPMDPYDIVDYVAEMGPLLQSGETISSFSVSPTTEAAALGFEINSTFQPVLETGNQNVLFWAQVNSANQNDDVWNGAGVQVPIEISFSTSSAPRRFQRTFLVEVRQL